jgi:hypothetical protein
MTKEQLRAELERKAKSLIDRGGGEVTLYAPQAKPDKRPWRKSPSRLNDAFQAELRQVESLEMGTLEGARR